jgi:hypothetical protein
LDEAVLEAAEETVTDSTTPLPPSP